jgi:hypothetical protein
MLGSRTVTPRLLRITIVSLLLLLAPACSRANSPVSARTEHVELEDHSHPPLVSPTLEAISAKFHTMGDPTLAVRLSRVVLVGAVQFPQVGGRLPVEERAVWPDRYELRLRGVPNEPPIVSLNGQALHVYLPPAWPRSFQPTQSFARLRLRSLFVMRYMAKALSTGAPLVPTTYPSTGVTAVEASDRYGPFRIVWGGLTEGMLAVEDEAGRVYFPAFFRSGPWFLPEMQSYESNGKLVEVLDVTSIETEPSA